MAGKVKAAKIAKKESANMEGIKVHESRGDRVFRLAITFICVLIGAVAFIPLLATISMSLSSRAAADMNIVTLWPVQPTTAAWRYVLEDASLWRSFGVTAAATFATIFLSLTLTVTMAYPLSKREFKAGSYIMIVVILTMIFKAPTVPYFLTIRGLGLYNNPLVLVAPHIFSAYNMAIMRTSFKAFPKEIEEAAVLDGCSTMQTLIRIVLPSSKATLTTIGLFYGVAAWNQFQNPMYFITDPKLYPLQMRVRQLINGGAEIMNELTTTLNNYNEATISAATIIISILPVIAVYPWLQKYFVKGAMLGSVKG